MMFATAAYSVRVQLPRQAPSTTPYMYKVLPVIQSTTFSSLTMMFARARIPHCLTCLGVEEQCNLIMTLWTRLLGPPDKGHCDIVTSQSRQLWPPQTGHCDQLNQPLRGLHLRLMQMGFAERSSKPLNQAAVVMIFLSRCRVCNADRSFRYTEVQPQE